MNIPMVSVVIPNLNGEAYLGRCLNSLLTGQYPNTEIILVDNGSKDRSVQIARNYQPRLKMIENATNRGFSRACNQGIRAATGEIVVLLNVDTIVDANWLLPVVEAFQNNPDTMIVGSRLIYADSELLQHAGGVIQGNGLTNHIGCGEDPTTSHLENKVVEYVCGAAMAIRKSFLNETGLLDEGYSPIYYEDTDLCVRANKLGHRVLFVADSVVYHFETHTADRSGFRYLYLFHRNRLRFVAKNYNWRDVLTRFLPYERWWLQNCGLPVIWKPVVAAYLNAIVRLPWLLVQKKLGRYRYLPSGMPDLSETNPSHRHTSQ